MLFRNESPLKLRRRISALLGYETVDDDEELGLGKLTEEEYQILLRRVYDDKISKITALRLGDYGDTSKEDDEAWKGEEDPFVHLTAVERQEIMKQMTVEEIRQAGYIQRKFAQKQMKRRSKTQKFRRPSFDDE